VSEAAEAFAREIASRPAIQGTYSQSTNRSVVSQQAVPVVCQAGFARVQPMQAIPVQGMPQPQRADYVLLAVTGMGSKD
jgi:hypothetical protein